MLRSSALTEDVEHVGPAPGIYESTQANNEESSVSHALKYVTASFFGEAALAFRHAKNLCDTPLMAILVQPVVSGCHVHAFAHADDIIINTSESNINAQDGQHETVVSGVSDS
jgi:phosphoenolpyruvate synthase/pyruvate phosphate dikinase